MLLVEKGNEMANEFKVKNGLITPDVELQGATSGTTILIAAATASGTLTVPAATDTLVGRATTDTLTNKTLTSPAINGGTATALTGLAVRDTSAAFDVTIAATSSTALTAGRTLTLNMVNAARSIKLGGNIDLVNNFSTGVGPVTLSSAGGGSSVVLPQSGTLSTLDGTETLTNKTINGTNNTISNISLTAAVTGTLPIGNGGTGQTTQTAAFDALSPLTTKGDILVDNGTNNVRLPVGTNGFVLTADSGVTEGVKWAALHTTETATNQTSPWAWNSNTIEQSSITALANALTINADAGTPFDGQKFVFRFKDNGVARALTWTTGSSKAFRAIGVTLPTTTVAGKTTYVGCIYNSADSRWDVTAVTTEA